MNDKLLTENEVRAIEWALYRLKGCYQDSQKALTKGMLALTADDNVKQYEALQSAGAKLRL